MRCLDGRRPQAVLLDVPANTITLTEQMAEVHKQLQLDGKERTGPLTIRFHFNPQKPMTQNNALQSHCERSKIESKLF